MRRPLAPALLRCLSQRTGGTAGTRPHPQRLQGREDRFNRWGPVTRFLDDARLPVDNNGSERALRPAALGRKNYLFIGHDKVEQNIAGLYSLIATCEVNGVNPVEYLADVLLRVQTHPASRIDELLPHNWTPPRPQPSA